MKISVESIFNILAKQSMAVDDDDLVSHEKVEHGLEYFMIGFARW